MYLAVDDLWLEHVAGTFKVDIVPSKMMPQIIIQLQPSAGKECGINVRLKAEKFKLKGMFVCYRRRCLLLDF